jgi:hypothetical protein
MPCKRCDHTMQGLHNNGPDSTKYIFWCPRCGTLKTEFRNQPDGNELPTIKWEEWNIPRWSRHSRRGD